MLPLALLSLIVTIAAETTPPSISSAPVVIQGCAVDQWHSYVYNYQGFKIQFINKGSVTADRVTFRATYAGVTKTFDDVGAFGPGIVVQHGYNVFRGLLFVSAVPVCAVETVHFVDGKIWRAQP